MLGLTQNEPLSLISIMEHAARWHGPQEIVSRRVEDGAIERQTYAETLPRVAKLANALTRLGIKPGDRIATMAWNTRRHVEVWYAAAGTGAVCHTLNPRLFAEQIEFIVNDARDRLLFIDLDIIKTIEPLLDKLPTLEAIIVLTDRKHMPDVSDKSGKWFCYDDLISDERATYEWLQLDNDAAASSLCYTSGTTGAPKGVLYSHRGNILHAMATVQKDAMNLGSEDSVLMVVPMFHANAWGLTFALPMVGAKMVLPGPYLDGASVYELLEREAVTFSAAVPTVWSMLLEHVKATGAQFSTLKEVMIGGAAAPRAMIETFEKDYGVHVIHVWGMTEMSPLGTLNRPLGWRAKPATADAEIDRRCSQGRVLYGVDMKIVDDEGNDLPRDGEAVGRLMVRGPWIVERYFEAEETALNDGWFDTGDVVAIDPDGFMHITDRAKDIIKSGGEWISSVEIENAAASHPDVALAACIGVAHPKWDERPLLLVKLCAGAIFDEDAIRAAIARLVAKWQVPEKIIEVSDIPLTATGKIDKKPLKTEYRDVYMRRA